MDVIFPNVPDVAGKVIDSDPQLKAILIAMKQTLEKLLGTDQQSNTSLIDYLNSQQD